MTGQAHPIFVFGEAMIELSGVQGSQAKLGVAGDTFNTAVYLSRVGQEIHFATALGDDAFSGRILTALTAENIKTEAVLIIKGGTPGLYAIELDESGERSFTYWRSASAARRFFDAPLASQTTDDMRAAKTLYLSGITLSIFEPAISRKNL